MENRVFGPVIRQGMEKGRKEEGALILRGQIAKRFGALPAWAEERLAELSVSELEDLSLRVLDAQNINEMFDR